MPEYSSAYRGCRERMTEIVTDAPEEQLTGRVPACPGWTIKDLYAHVTGVAEDFAGGNVDHVGSDEWTAAQVMRRSELSVPEMVDQWQRISQQVEQTLDQIPPGGAAMMIGDVVTHEHDLRGAAHRPGARDSDAVWIGLDRFIKWFGKRIKDSGLPSVLVHSGGRDWQAGVLEAEVELEGEPYELLRALTGRRTQEEIRSLTWSRDPGPYIDLFSTFPPAQATLSED